MAWSTVKEGVRSAVALALKLPDFTGAGGGTRQRVRWAGESEDNGWVKHNEPTVDLELGVVRGLATDETRYEIVDLADPPGSDPLLQYLKPHYTGNRLFTVRVRIDHTDQTSAEDSVGARAGLLRTRLKRDDVRALLSAANVAIQRIGDTLNADAVDEDGRQLSISVTDLYLATTETDTDTSAVGYDWVRTAAGQGELAGDVGDTAVDTTFDTTP